MIRPNINRAFDRMGETWAHKIDPSHFLGRSAFDIPRKKEVVPAANIKKDGKLFELELAVPGFDKEEIEISVREDILLIRGEKSSSAPQHKSEYILEEFDFSSFERSFKLAPTLSHEKITAKLERGILRLTFIDVPKEEEKAIQKVKVE
jgi:HSP20 family protein